MGKKPNRRDFLKGSTAVAALTVVPSWVSAGMPREQLNFAAIGVGGKGGGDLRSISSHKAVRVMGLCDIDRNQLGKASDKFKDAGTWSDWREMLDKIGDKLDAVQVATPDHTHAPASMGAINKGIHVFSEKPLTHDIHEARMLKEAARKKKVVTQMGIQIHSSSEYRTAVKVIQDGAIGKVKEVHSWSSKGSGYEGERPAGSDPVPDWLDWDNWLGTAPERPYKKKMYHPSGWRRWYDFGCGTMGDMSIHILDPVTKALGLNYPKEAISDTEKVWPESYTKKNRVRYVFPATEYTAGDLPLTWYDGAFKPDFKGMGWPVMRLANQGSMFIGEKGCMLLPHIAMPKLLPEDDFEDYEIEPVPGSDHYHQWVDACLGKGETSANFDYAGPLTEYVLIGVIANRNPGIRLIWDAENLRFKDCDEANKLVRRTYRKGFEVEGL